MAPNRPAPLRPSCISLVIIMNCYFPLDYFTSTDNTTAAEAYRQHHGRRSIPARLYKPEWTPNPTLFTMLYTLCRADMLSAPHRSTCLHSALNRSAQLYTFQTALHSTLLICSAQLHTYLHSSTLCLNTSTRPKQLYSTVETIVHFARHYMGWEKRQTPPLIHG
eukprot:4618119-Pyramimonas_sp.AAC.1